MDKPWFEGRRIVELDTLATNMYCHKCNAWLRLSDIVDEVIHGLASYLYIKCTNAVCNHINLVPTGKRNAKRGFDVNSKAYLGNNISQIVQNYCSNLDEIRIDWSKPVVNFIFCMTRNDVTDTLNRSSATSIFDKISNIYDNFSANK
jgi:hypothetical protein